MGDVAKPDADAAKGRARATLSTTLVKSASHTTGMRSSLRLPKRYVGRCPLVWKKDAHRSQHTFVANQLFAIGKTQLRLSVPRGSCLHYRVRCRTGRSLHQNRDAQVPFASNQHVFTVALVPVKKAPWVNARCICVRDRRAFNHPNAPLKPVPLLRLPRARLALNRSRPADFFGFPAQDSRQHRPSHVDHSSRGNPKALTHEEDGRRVSLVAEPKQRNCELYTDGKLRTPRWRMKDIGR